MTADIYSLASAIDDGFNDLLAKRDELAAAKAQNVADTPPSPGPYDFVNEYLQEGRNLRDIATGEVTGRRVLADILQVEFTAIQRAQAVVFQDIATWMTSHQPELCEALHPLRVDVQQRARTLLKERYPNPDQMAALVAEWRELRREHTDLIDVNPRRASIRWRGLDWVDQYATAWPDFWKVDGLKEPLPDRVRNVSHPFDPEVLDLHESVGPDPLTDRETLDQLIRVRVWTPTRRQYDTQYALLDVTANRRRLEAAREAATEARATERIDANTDRSFMTVTKDPWRE